MDPSLFYGKSSRTGESQIIVKTIENPQDSDDSLLSDSDDGDDIPVEPHSFLEEEDEIENVSQVVIPEPDFEDTQENPNDNESGEEDHGVWEAEDMRPLADITNQRNRKKTKQKEKRNVTWKSGKARQIRPILPWKGQLPDGPEIVGTPLFYFRKLIDRDILEHVVEQSNLYALQTDLARPLTLSVEELERFIGVTFLMSIYGLPRTRMFWRRETEVLKVVEAMSRNRWEQLKSKIHFNDNTHLAESNDKLYKIRPFIDKVVKNFNKIPMGEKICVDEQMIPYKGHHSIKQYMKAKPKKWGYKAFVLCGSDGIVYNWELYSGAVDHDPDLPDVGISGNVVLRLAKIVPRNDYHKIYFDNWFNGLQLQIELQKIGILSLGTVRPNRLEGCSFTDDKEMRKKGRGYVEERKAVVEGVELLAIKWYDNKPVTLLSSFVGAYPTTQVKRWDSKSKAKVDVDCPSAVTVYNQFMGGVDLVDSLVALYRTTIRSKKWYHKIYFHLMDLCVVNSWLLYRRDCASCGVPKKEQLSLLQFKADLASTLCSTGDPQKDQKKRGRPSSSSVQQEMEQKFKRGKPAVMPTLDTRRDGVAHWPTFQEKRGRCKFPGCGGVPKIFCAKCKVHLCLTATQNCFLKFHNE